MEVQLPQTFSNMGEAATARDASGDYVGRIIVTAPLFPTLNLVKRHDYSIYKLEVENIKTGKKKRKRIGKEWRSRYKINLTLRVDELKFTPVGLEATLVETITTLPCEQTTVMQQVPSFHEHVMRPVQIYTLHANKSYKEYKISRKRFPK